MCEATYWYSDTDPFQVKANILKIAKLLSTNLSASALYFQVQNIQKPVGNSWKQQTGIISKNGKDYLSLTRNKIT